MDFKDILTHNAAQFKKFWNSIVPDQQQMLYKQLWTNLEHCISSDNPKQLQKIVTFITIITESTQNKQDLNTWFKESNPLHSTNLLILCCKHNRKDCLEFLIVKNKGVCLKNLSTDIYLKYPSVEDIDEQKHNAFYYAIRNGNIRMVELIFDHFFNDESLNEELEQSLASACDELLLRNVKLSEEMAWFVDKQLFQLRFWYGTSENKPQSKNNFQNKDLGIQIKHRIDVVLNIINTIVTEFSDEYEFDQKLLFLCQTLAKNIHVLKLKFRSTYFVLPWEEIEFIVIAFVLPHIKHHQNNIFYLTVLKRVQFIRHLKTFAKKLSNEMPNLMNSNTSFYNFPSEERYLRTETMRKDNPELNDLIHDFETLRDVHSFEKITEAIRLANSVDLNDPNGLLIISRVLQSIGEHFKNTWESPNMSPNASRIVLACMPNTIKENLEKFRNIISKKATMKNNSKFSTKFIQIIQTDLKELRKIIDKIVNEKITALIYKYLNAICDCKTSDEILKIFKIFKLVGVDIGQFYRDKGDVIRLKSLIKELDDMVKNDENADLFKRIYVELDKPENQYSLIRDEHLKCFQLMDFVAKQEVENEKDMDYLQYIIKATLKKFDISKRKGNVNNLFELINELGNSLLLERDTKYNDADVETTGGRMKNLKLKEIKTQEVLKELLVLCQLDSPNLRWIEDLTFEFGYMSSMTEIDDEDLTADKNIVNQLFNKLQMILNFFDKPQIDFDSWNKYNKDKNLQASCEMLYMDIVSLNDKFTFIYNNKYLDESHTFLMGKELRNHLAHHNSLIEILPINAERCLLLNLVQLLKEFNAGNFENSKIIIGKKKSNEDLFRYCSKYDDQLNIIAIQNDMLMAQQLGQTNDIKKLVQKGADLMGRDIRQKTSLHLAVAHTNLQTIEELLEMGLDPNEKDADGFTTLQISVQCNNIIAVDYFLQKYQINLKQMVSLSNIPSVNDIPLIHIAAQKGSSEMIRLLLKYNADVDNVFYAHRPLDLSILARNADTAKVFIEHVSDVNSYFADGCPLLYISAEKDLLEVVKLLIKQGANINARNDKSATVLHAACLSASNEMIKFLLENGAVTDINSVNADGATPLYIAARKGSYNVIKLLLDFGADPNIPHQMMKSTVLHRLCENGHIETVKLILNCVSIEQLVKKDINSRIPADYAAENGHIEILKLLLNNIPASIDREQFSGTALYIGAFNGHLDVVKLLIDQISDIDFFLDPLIAAAGAGHMQIIKFLLCKKFDWYKSHFEHLKCAFDYAVLNKQFDTLSLLLEKYGIISNDIFEAAACNRAIFQHILKHRVNINTIDEKGNAIIHYAAMNGNLEIVNDLITNNADIRLKRKTKKQETALILAARSNSVDIIKALSFVTVPTEIEVEDCLMEAIKWNNFNVVRFLLKQSILQQEQLFRCLKKAILLGCFKIINILLRDKYLVLRRREYSELLCLSALYGSRVISQVVFEQGADIEYSLKDNQTPLHISVSNNDYEMAKFFIDKQAKLDVKTHSQGLTPVIICAKYGYDDILKLLLDNRADPVATNFDGQTPIELAVKYNNVECVKYLLATKKIDVSHYIDKAKNTLLHFAAAEGLLDITVCLCEHGADVHRFNLDGAKPIHLGAKKNQWDIVQFYLKKGLSIDVQAKNQLSPLHYAAIANQPEMIKLLMKAGASINLKAEHDYTPLDMAYLANSSDAVQILLYFGAVCTNQPLNPSISKKSQGILVATQKLFDCVKSDNYKQIERLIEHEKAQVNAKNDEDLTILHYASCKGYTRCVKVILSNGGDPNIVGSGMNTALHYAAKHNHFEIVKELLKHGAIYNLKGIDGNIPSQQTNNENIKSLFNSISSAFARIQSKNEILVKNLSKIKNVDIFKAVINARNERNETIILTAVKTSYPHLADLLQVNQKVSGYEFEAQIYKLSAAQRFSEAIVFLKQVKEDRSKLFGTNCPGNTIIEHLIAFQMNNQHKCLEAFNLCNEIYEKQKDLFGETCKYTLKTNQLKSTILYCLGRYEEALATITSVITIQENPTAHHSDTFDSDYSDTNHSLGLVLQIMEKYEDALKAFRKAVKYGRKAHGANNQTTLASENNVAQTLFLMGKQDEALEMYENIRSRREKYLGPNHSDTLRTTFNIVEVYKMKGDKSKALDELLCLFDKQKKALGANHFDTLRTQSQIGIMLIENYKLHWAQKYIEESIPGLTQKLGVHHPSIIQLMQHLEVIKTTMKTSGMNSTKLVLEKINKDLIEVVNKGDLPEAKILLNAGANINTKDDAGFCPIHFAVRKNNRQTIEFLLEMSADPTQVSNKGNTPLHTAASMGHDELADILLKYVKQNNFPSFFDFINAQTTVGKSTALHVAVKGGFLAMTKVLLKHGAIFDLIDGNHLKPLDHCNGNKSENEIAHILRQCSDLFTEAETSMIRVWKSLVAIKADPELFSIITSARNYRNKNLMGVAVECSKENTIEVMKFKKDFIRLVQENSKML